MKTETKNKNCPQDATLFASNFFFRGHEFEAQSCLITQLFAGVDFLTDVLVHEFQICLLSNLNNLYVVRGNLNPVSKRLQLKSSMTGPHHYFGFLDPRKCYRLQIDENLGVTIICCQHSDINFENLKPIASTVRYLDAIDYEWISHNINSDKNVSLFAKPGTFLFHTTPRNIRSWNMHKIMIGRHSERS